jgi:L-asparaginase
MKTILIIHTGGTFGMLPMKPSSTLAPGRVQEEITRYAPELLQIANIDFHAAFNLDSADMQPFHWQRLATHIYQNIDKYDGFVIIHGTDSMSYTAAALSFMLQNLPKPVILTGSQRPIAEIRTDARMNLINAVELATHLIPEVGIFFGTGLFRGNRAVKVSSTDYGAFISPNFPSLAEVGLEINIFDHHLRPGGTLQLKTAISDEVLVIPYFPGQQPEYLQWLPESPVKALVIEALGLGNVAIKDHGLVSLIEKLGAAEKLVVITSQSRRGRVDLSRYENGRHLQQAGAVGAYDMTFEATIVKLMHLLGNYPGNIAKVREQLCTPLAGEITPSG